MTNRYNRMEAIIWPSSWPISAADLSRGRRVVVLLQRFSNIWRQCEFQKQKLPLKMKSDKHTRNFLLIRYCLSIFIFIVMILFLKDVFTTDYVWLSQVKAVQWHPDKNRGKPTEKDATEKFQRISAAYKRLTEVVFYKLYSHLHLL